MTTNARRAFALSWLAYASYYVGRKGFSVVKSAVAREQGLDASALAWIDTTYLAAYACGQLPSGIAADRWGARWVVSLGMLLSAAACMLFGWSNGAGAFAVCFAINGVAQATGWPGSTKMVAEHTRPEARGRVMGLWSTCYQVGGVAATALATWCLAHLGWRAAFRLPALWLALIALLVMSLAPSAAPATTQSAPRAALSRNALRNKVLYSYGTSYFCIKLIRYSLLFWLPYYLHAAAGLSEVASGYVSTAFDAGGVLGSIGLGYASDKLPRARGLVAAAGLIGLAAALLAYANVAASSIAWHCGALALIGMLLFGPDSLISGAAAQEAASATEAATAVGLVNGMGSVGALFQGVLTVSVQQAFGWDALFRVFVGLSLVAAACLSPALFSKREC
jgi:OPA family sugar phosphate sensor protein UhpC-like MFS transporter